MREPFLSGGLFALGIGLVVFVQMINLPPKPSEDVLLQRQRDEKIVEYLFLKSDLVNQTHVEQFLENLEKDAQESPEIADLVALFLALEGQGERAQNLLALLPEGEKKQLLTFSFQLGESLPAAWETQYPDGWMKAKVASLVYKIQNNDERYAESLVSIREYENVTHRFASINAMFQILGFMGFMFLIGMLFARRYYQMVGKPFFPLSPIYISPIRLLRFCGLLLIGFVFTGSLAQWLFGNTSSIWAMVSGYFLFMAVTAYLTWQVFFEPKQDQRLQTLQLDNLRMGFSKLWQIFKSLTILVALCLGGIAMSYWLGWSIDRFHQNALYQQLLDEPVSAGILFIFACIIAPIFEEIVFRGMVQRSLLCFGKPLPAILGAALLFTFIHPMAQWPTTFAIGLGLGLVYQRTADLLVCIWAHAAWNGLVLLLLSYGVFL